MPGIAGPCRSARASTRRKTQISVLGGPTYVRSVGSHARSARARTSETQIPGLGAYVSGAHVRFKKAHRKCEVHTPGLGSLYQIWWGSCQICDCEGQYTTCGAYPRPGRAYARSRVATSGLVRSMPGLRGTVKDVRRKHQVIEALYLALRAHARPVGALVVFS